MTTSAAFQKSALATFFCFILLAYTGNAQNSQISIPPSDYADDLKAIIAAMNVPITFYGIIVDQDGKPLKGATVTLSVQQPYFADSDEIGHPFRSNLDTVPGYLDSCRSEATLCLNS